MKTENKMVLRSNRGGRTESFVPYFDDLDENSKSSKKLRTEWVFTADYDKEGKPTYSWINDGDGCEVLDDGSAFGEYVTSVPQELLLTICALINTIPKLLEAEE